MFPTSDKKFPHRVLCLILAWTAALVMLCLGCDSPSSYRPLPANLEDQAQIPGLPGVRDWADAPSQIILNCARESLKQERAANQGKLKPVVYGLALSGGGGEGAFGAGLLCGWSEAGTRPTFKLVTGISTGALIAPLAFLGSDYDHLLKEMFTTISDKDIYVEHSALALLLSIINLRPLPSLDSTKPLAKLLKKHVDVKMLDKIAAAHLQGRRLLVGTTQLDAQRLVIWDLGAVAASDYPHKLELFHKILLASASIPGKFPPQFFTVTAGGQEFQEMHVDGGVRVEILLYEDALEPLIVDDKRERHLYIIRNDQVFPEWQHVNPRLRDIAQRTINSILKTQGVGDIYRLYVYARRDGVDFNLAYIPPYFPPRSRDEFDKPYMNKLFDDAYNKAKNGYPWHKHPPFFKPAAEAFGQR
jgi:hypothetical protein